MAQVSNPKKAFMLSASLVGAETLPAVSAAASTSLDRNYHHHQLAFISSSSGSATTTTTQRWHDPQCVAASNTGGVTSFLNQSPRWVSSSSVVASLLPGSNAEWIEEPLQPATMITPTSSSSSSSEDIAAAVLQGTTTPSVVQDVLSIPQIYSLRNVLQVDTLRPAAAALSRPQRPQRVIGHRGALFDALENTRESFLRCVELGCDGVELDVFALPPKCDPNQEPTVIVFHGGGTDANPGDLTEYCLQQNGVSILDLTFDETQQLRFNPNFAEFGCDPRIIEQARIPTLEQVLRDLKGTGLHVKIELKGPNTVEPTLAIVDRLDMTDQCSYSSFHHEWLRQLRQLRPDAQKYPTGALFDKKHLPVDFIQQALECGATEVHLQYDTCTVKRIQAIRAAGLRSMAWFRGPIGMRYDSRNLYWDVGNEDEACYQAVLDTGVDDLCVNRPDVLLRVMGRLNSAN